MMSMQFTRARSNFLKDYEADGPKLFDPDIGLVNHELPRWCRFPEPIAFEMQDEAGCQDTGRRSSGLMDRYVIRRMTQMIAPVQTPPSTWHCRLQATIHEEEA